MTYIGSAIEYGDILLQAVLLVLLLFASNVRRYPLLFLYCLVLFSISVLEWWAMMHGATYGTPRWRTIYWRNEVVVDLLLFFLVIALASQAMEGSPLRSKTRRLLAMVTLVMVVLPLVVFPMRFSSRWFYSTSQLLNFGAAILNLALWGALLANRKRDPRLLAVSAGLGVAVTGAAIAFGLSQFIGSGALQLVDLFKSATHAASMVIWCWAFLPRTKAPPLTGRPLTSP